MNLNPILPNQNSAIAGCNQNFKGLRKREMGPNQRIPSSYLAFSSAWLMVVEKIIRDRALAIVDVLHWTSINDQRERSGDGVVFKLNMGKARILFSFGFPPSKIDNEASIESLPSSMHVQCASFFSWVWASIMLLGLSNGPDLASKWAISSRSPL